MQFLGSGHNQGASNTDGQQSVAVVLATGPARGNPSPETTDPSAMERREQNQTNNNRPSNIHHLPSRSHTHTTHHHHHRSPCQPPSPTFLQVLDHPHSKLGVGGQAPTPTSDLPGGWPKNLHSSQQEGYGTAAKADRHMTPTTTATRHPNDTIPPRSHPFAHPTATGEDPTGLLVSAPAEARAVSVSPPSRKQASGDRSADHPNVGAAH